jgi:hypothetical protein
MEKIQNSRLTILLKQIGGKTINYDSDPIVMESIFFKELNFYKPLK